MTWLRRRSHERTESEATQARKAAEVELTRVKAETEQYQELAASLRSIRVENHLTELIGNIPSRRRRHS